MTPLLKTFAAGAAALAFACSPVLAQTFPSKPVRIVVGFSPGGSNDIIARLIAPKLGELLGQQVVVENRTGAGGAIAISSVLAAPADGHTLSMCTTGTSSIQPHLGPMPFNPETDLVPVTQIANAPYVLMVHSSLPAKNVREFVAYAKQNPGKINFASSGNATGGHLAGEMFKSLAGVNLVHVPYKGTSQAITDLLSGQVQVIFDQPVSSMQYARSGQLRALGVGSLKRLGAFPDLPTIHEAGVPNFDPVTWTGICAPKNTPPAAVARLQADIAKVLAMPEISRKLVQDGLEPVGSTPEQFREFLAADKAKWGRVIKQANVKAE
ncbi:Bug family tripartite tricarboxylate transporter substrate binding protein [Ramlibacter sp. Leaf400]|uniref:Bug family tripartite tricarboxylate transporter substrate binding protein n=1 Tax=Ramlibacter sp. Leaf400 TaxID=1736365 RepID=UPI0006F9A542|nr:tripartite tricarboxylate transporter substrate binding protein [Ramlibacter sp. Leaf400]KQT11346.1 ABC transporter substrate-binding protein [Ramlibacter sp. Leaf400]